jgi:pilus assembly protein CpaF
VFLAKRVANAFDYIFHFVQLRDKNQKRLKSISEISFDRENDRVVVNTICQYDFLTERWNFASKIGERKVEIALQENPNQYRVFQGQLAELALRKGGVR